MGLTGISGYYVLYTLLTLLLFIMARKKLEGMRYAGQAFFLAVLIGAVAPLLSFAFGSAIGIGLLAIIAGGLAISFPFERGEETEWVYVPLEEKAEPEDVEEEETLLQEEDKEDILFVMEEEAEQEMNDIMNYESFSAPAKETHSMIDDMPFEDFKSLDTVAISEPEVMPDSEVQTGALSFEKESVDLGWEWEPSFSDEEEEEQDGDDKKAEDEPVSESYFTRLGDVMAEEGISFERLDNLDVRPEDTEERGQHRA